MDVATLILYSIGVIFAALVLAVIVKVVRHGGFRGAMFGAPIESTVGEIKVASSALTSTTVKVHALPAKGARGWIGVRHEIAGRLSHDAVHSDRGSGPKLEVP